jgi:hypothetical protein
MKRLLQAAALAGFFACSSGQKTDEQAFLEGLDSAQGTSPVLDQQAISSILGEIPSPLEISVMLKEGGSKYDPSILNSPDNIEKYNTNYHRALNLGIYGADLGYTNIYEQTNDGVKYMSSIEELAEGLNIGQFFDYATIRRLANNSKNLDSLLLITTQNFNSINAFLQSQNRSHLSVLFLTGGWLEAMNITCQVALKSPGNKEIQETIGSQKIILEKVILLLNAFSQTDPKMASLLKDMEQLQTAYGPVTITYNYQEPSFEIVDGVMVIKDKSTSTVQITESDVTAIREATQAIRSKIVS